MTIPFPYFFPYVPILSIFSILYFYCANTNSATRLEPHVVRKMDSDEDSDNPPPTHIRWFHAGHGLAHLDLLATPIPVLAKAASAPITSWTAFTREESDCCEAAWHALSDEQRANALAGDPGLPVAAPLINDDDEVSQSINILTTERTYHLYATGGAHTRYPYRKRAAFRGRSPNAACTSPHLTLVNHS